MDMIDDKKSDERYQIGENHEDRLTDDIRKLKLGILSSQKSLENIDKESNEINQIYMIDDKES